MKIDINVVQHGSAAVMFVVFIFYPLFFIHTSYIKFGIGIWAFSLPILYIPYLLESPEVSKKEKKDPKKGSILGSWLFALFWWSVLLENDYLRIVTMVFFIILIVYCLYYIKKHWKEEKGTEEGLNES
jgi:Ca2+/Na+ antiporter